MLNAAGVQTLAICQGQHVWQRSLATMPDEAPNRHR